MPKTIKLASKSINSFLPADRREAIDMLCKEFKDTKNPLVLMDVFIRSCDAGIYPPVPMLQVVAEAFREVRLRGGRKTLDQALGLVLTGRGNRSVFTDLNKKNETYTVALMIWQLMVGPEKASEADAVERVALHLENRSPRIIPRLRRYKADGLKRTFPQWRQAFYLDDIEPASRLHPASWTPTRLAWLCTNFPSPKISPRSKRS